MQSAWKLSSAHFIYYQELASAKKERECVCVCVCIYGVVGALSLFLSVSTSSSGCNPVKALMDWYIYIGVWIDNKTRALQSAVLVDIGTGSAITDRMFQSNRWGWQNKTKQNKIYNLKGNSVVYWPITDYRFDTSDLIGLQRLRQSGSMAEIITTSLNRPLSSATRPAKKGEKVNG